MLLGAEFGYGWRVEYTLENAGAPEHLRTWRVDLFGFDPSGVCAPDGRVHFLPHG